MKDPIFAAGTKYQIGGCPGQRTQFHIFVIKSLIALRLLGGVGILLTLLDIVKFFDKQSLVDAMDALCQAKVNPKNYRVRYTKCGYKEHFTVLQHIAICGQMHYFL